MFNTHISNFEQLKDNKKERIMLSYLINIHKLQIQEI